MAAPSQTVENYLKAIYQAQLSISDSELVPMGQLAESLGVVPGTATTMVKALAESGLAHYEPYAGVRLTAAGQKLAAMVLRRHRLIELFLVRVMGMSWTEVHDEAENLEHAVSDRLIGLIDDMLGHPAVDPHGDPIPDRHGALASHEYDSLLTCGIGTPVTIARVSDQDRSFLQFAEKHELRPGDTVQVEERSAEGDSVRLRVRNNRKLTIGARAASKVLVRAASALAILLMLSQTLLAQNSGSSEPFRITDNSFLVEEAFNQEKGIFQNIFGMMRIGGILSASFTQEWPVPAKAHQLSYTVLLVDVDRKNGFGDMLINYRYQLMEEGPGRPACSPRASLILPTGDSNDGLGDGSIGVQANVPFSKQTGDWYWHWNVGLTWLKSARATLHEGDLVSIRRDPLASPFFAASAIYRLRPMFHLMLESIATSDQEIEINGTSRQGTFTLSPGLRTGWDLGEKQLVLGIAVPITWAIGTDTGLFVYASYELPFRKN
ncbi:MAG TPA: metal-dependent transcriptional regulator [Vicinamibacterales bacterium]|jgi:DtxR family Mn-dependent transcriptional regulator|nr:metal-dependent transcriptional regulator [Vicinamibacterales bacterium]